MECNFNSADSTEPLLKIFIPFFGWGSNRAINPASNSFSRQISQILKIFSRLFNQSSASTNVGLKVPRIDAVCINEVTLSTSEPVAAIRAICARVNFYNARFDSFEDLFDLETNDPNIVYPLVSARIGLGLLLRAVNNSANENR